MPLLLLALLIALVQSTIYAIILSARVIVGRVILLWLNCAVSVKRSLLVDLMWHKWVR